MVGSTREGRQRPDGFRAHLPAEPLHLRRVERLAGKVAGVLRPCRRDAATHHRPAHWLRSSGLAVLAIHGFHCVDGLPAPAVLFHRYDFRPPLHERRLRAIQCQVQSGFQHLGDHLPARATANDRSAASAIGPRADLHACGKEIFYESLDRLHEVMPQKPV